MEAQGQVTHELEAMRVVQREQQRTSLIDGSEAPVLFAIWSPKTLILSS